MLRAFYENICVDYDAILKRFSDEDIILRFVKRFPSDPSFENLKSALEAGRKREAFLAVHNMKGLCANLAFTRLQECASEMTELLRDESCDLEPARVAFDRLSEDYDKVIGEIAQLG